MNRIANVLALHFKGWFVWLAIPWSIVLSSFVINLLVALILGRRGEIYTGGLASIYCFMLILGGLVVRDTFSFALGFSVRRRDYYLGTLVMLVACSLASAVLLWLLSIVEDQLIPGWGLHLHFFHLPYLNEGSLAGQLWIYFVVMLFMFLLAFLPAAVFQRFKTPGLLWLTGIVLLPLTIVGYAAIRYNWWGAIFGWFARQSAFDLASWTLVPIALCVLGSYLLLRRASA